VTAAKFSAARKAKIEAAGGTELPPHQVDGGVTIKPKVWRAQTCGTNKEEARPPLESDSTESEA
jgi:hypothetical protein